MKKRMLALLAAVLTATFALGWRLDLLHRPTLAVMAAGPGGSTGVFAKELRGPILDRNGQPLTENGTDYLTVIEPQYFMQRQQSALLLELLGDVTQELEEGIPFWRMCRQPLDLPGITQIPLQDRYGADVPAIHLLGYTDESGTAGLSGLEQRYDSLLRDAGEVRYQYPSDAKGHSMGTNSVKITVQQRETGSLQLTLDRELQQVVTELVRDELPAGCVLLADVQSGEVLAMESSPAFDPKQVGKYLESEGGELVNRCFQGYPPGSVFKLVVAAAALENGYTPEQQFCCTGMIDCGGVQIPCAHTEGHGLLRMEDAMAQSCNPYFIHMAQQLGGGQLLKYAAKLGLTGPVDLGDGMTVQHELLPDEAALTAPAALGNFAIGQGDFLVTPLQMLRMMVAIVRGGRGTELHLIKKVGDKTIKYDNFEKIEGIHPETAVELQNMMRKVVEEGIGNSAEAEGLSICGKTSSAQAGGQTVHGWFAGFWPQGEPRYAMVVLTENSGGSAAACRLYQKLATAISKMR